MKKIVYLTLILGLISGLLAGCYPNPSFNDVARALQSSLCSWMQNPANGRLFAYYKVGITETGEAIYRWALMAADGTEITHSGPTMLLKMLDIVNFRIAEGFRYITYFDIDPTTMTAIIVTVITYLPSMSFFIFNPVTIFKWQPTTVPSGYIQSYP